METKELKKKLIKKIEAADENELRQLENMLNAIEKNEEDWFYNLPVPIQELLKKSIKQIEEGKTLTHEQVMKETRAKYGLERKTDPANPTKEVRDLLEIAQNQVANGQTKTNEEVKELIKNKYGFQIK